MIIEGFLRKNHAGSDFATKNVRRFYVAEGFTVFYYTDATKRQTKGHFDLRNVIRLRAHDVSDASVGAGAINLWIAEPKSNEPPKKMVISFSLEPTRREKWLKLFCSAVYPAYVEEGLRAFADAALGESLNASYGDVQAVASKRSRFSKAAPTTGVLTPRSSITPRPGGAEPTEAEKKQQVLERVAGITAPQPPPPAEEASQLDTPRGAPDTPRGAPETPTAPVAAGDAPTGGGGEDVTFEITVPEGVQPGDRLQATTPSGLRVKLSVPEGATAGTILTFALPASGAGHADLENQAAILIQARIRGLVTRKTGTPAKKAVILTATPEEQQAIVKLQSSFRGHSTRNEQQEASRLQWMTYYMQPAVSEWEEALALAVTPEEEHKVHEARAAVRGEEQKRVKWFAHYLQTRNLDKAAELMVTPLEAARVLHARARLDLGPCACCLPQAGASAYEAERSTKLTASIVSYEWDVAEVLAATPEEIQDVTDSKLRVQLLEAALAEGDYTEARRLAINETERQRIADRQPPPAPPAHPPPTRTAP